MGWTGRTTGRCADTGRSSPCERWGAPDPGVTLATSGPVKKEFEKVSADVSIGVPPVRRESEKAGYEARSTSGSLVPPPRHKETSMRVMVLVKANKDSEAGVMPAMELIEAMGTFN